ncbi:hypothetical protein AMAG_01452 [Allomyces macrogynus ATCC 38327]|uniref:Uncharacterized protein n=1 Tax=Allomyces macrogynus (strain ATCC 38327) TaxID=578462 RepID=A0A0L0RZP9_ALLM3|nr:hypothetical protein AMAG_01452 [Allomyces macrogynus ATCC 38327]|eukprot:KNE55561.1 hypothetical protein AMAG_01452 [Allomyces macrogynus ATCC 38327]
MPPPPPVLSAASTALPAGRSAAPALAAPSTSPPSDSTVLHAPAAPTPLAPLPARRGHYVTRAAVLRDVHRPTLHTTSPHVAVGGGSVLPVGRAPDLASGRARSSGSLAAAAATVLARDSTGNLAGATTAAPVPIDRAASTVRFSEDALFRGNESWTNLAVSSAVALAGSDGVQTDPAKGAAPPARTRSRKPAPTRLASIPRARRTSLPDSCELRPIMAVHGQTVPTVFASMHALDGRGVPRAESTPGNALGSSFSILAEILRQADTSTLVSQSDPGTASAAGATGREFGGGVVHITLDHASSSTPVLTPAPPESPPVPDQCPVILEETPVVRGRSATRTWTGSASPHRPPSASPARQPSAVSSAAPPGPDLYLGTSPPRAASARPGSARPGSRPPTRPRSPMRPILAGADPPPPLTDFEVQATPLRRPSGSDESQPGSTSPRARRATEPSLTTGLGPPDWTVTGTAPPATARQRSSTVPDGAPPAVPPLRPTTARSIPASPVPPAELAASVLINHRPSVADPAAVARASIADPPPPPVRGLHRFAVIVTKSFGHAMTAVPGPRAPAHAAVVAGTRIVQQPGTVPAGPFPNRSGGGGGGMLESVGLTVTKMPVAPPPMAISMIARPVPAAPPPPPPARKTPVPPVLPAPTPVKPTADSAVDGLKASKIAVPPPRPSSPARRPAPKPEPATVPVAPLKSILKKPVPARPVETVPEAEAVPEPVPEPEPPAEPAVVEGEGTVVEVDVLPEQDPMEAAVNALVEKLSPRLLATEHIQRFNFVNDYTRLLRRHEDLMQKNLVNNNISTLDVDTRYIEPLSEDQLMTMVWNMYFFVYSLGTKFVLAQLMQQAIKKCIDSDEADDVKVGQLRDMFGKLSKSERMNYKAVIGHCFRIATAATSDLIVFPMVTIFGSVLLPNLASSSDLVGLVAAPAPAPPPPPPAPAKPKSFLDAVRRGTFKDPALTTSQDLLCEPNPDDVDDAMTDEDGTESILAAASAVPDNVVAPMAELRAMRERIATVLVDAAVAALPREARAMLYVVENFEDVFG